MFTPVKLFVLNIPDGTNVPVETRLTQSARKAVVEKDTGVQV